VGDELEDDRGIGFHVHQRRLLDDGALDDEVTGAVEAVAVASGQETSLLGQGRLLIREI
jgi:hypothetical protein